MTLTPTNMPNYARRKLIDRLMRGLTLVATGLAVVPLVLILGYVTVVGGGAMLTGFPRFFTESYQAPVAVDGLDAAPQAAPVDPNAAPGTAATVDPFAGISVPGFGDPNTTPALGATADPSANLPIPGVSDPNAMPGTIEAAPTAELNVEARGGVLHGIVGTLLVTLTALLIAVPVGLLAGVFLAEYQNNPLATFVRFCCDVLSGAPSIVIGVVGYILIVRRFQTYSGLAGSIALTFLMVPTITRTTEEMLKLVSSSAREAALALGAPMWYSTFTVVLPTALGGIVTGILLAFARGAGETAPLLLTIQGSNVLAVNLLEPIAALPLLTYKYTESPFPAENNLAWGTAFVLMMLVLIVNVLVRLATRNRMGGR